MDQHMGDFMSSVFEDDLLTPDEVATVLRVHPSTVRHWLRNGTISGIVLTVGEKKGRERRWYRVPRTIVEHLLRCGSNQITSRCSAEGGNYY